MHIQIQVDYGVRALIDLAEHAGEGSIHTSEIARRKGIPEPYLARVLHSLSQHGFTASHRGPTGGHVLALPPNEITMGMVMDRLGGPQRLMGCLDNSEFCDQVGSCGQQEVWREVEDAIHGVLNSTTIADLVQRMNQGGRHQRSELASSI